QGRLPGLIRLADDPDWDGVVEDVLALRDDDLPADFRQLDEMDEALDERADDDRGDDGGGEGISAEDELSPRTS
ncbi:MAG TPA: hypothetical protein VER37_06530, partial [Thermomicrobiales bacterium]|nr:hypothetical protein [Thermomicrobiales bacterium]